MRRRFIPHRRLIMLHPLIMRRPQWWSSRLRFIMDRAIMVARITIGGTMAVAATGIIITIGIGVKLLPFCLKAGTLRRLGFFLLTRFPAPPEARQEFAI